MPSIGGSNLKTAESINLRACLALLGLGVLFVALRWNNYDLPLVRDEGEYAYSAQLLKHGLAPYEYSFLQKPPMVVYTYALADALAPHVFWFPRVLAALFMALATGLLGVIARLEFGPGAALPVTWLFTPLVLLPEVQQFTANTEMFLLLPLLATITSYAAARHRGSGSWPWALAGFLGATAVWYKYTAVAVLGPLFVFWSVEEWRAGLRPLGLLRRWGFVLLGACVASAAVLAFFLARDAGKRLWECTILFNRYYAASRFFGWRSLWVVVKVLWADWWLLFLLPLLLVVSPAPRIRFWFAMFLAAWFSTRLSIFGHYYIIVMPFWALLIFAAIRRLVGWAAPKLSLSEAWLRRALTGVVVLVVCLSHLPWIVRSRDEFAAGRLGGENPFTESLPVAKRVAELTSPADFVYVAGSEPQILYYAQRFSPTRFVITYPLMIPTPLAKGCQKEAIRELKQRPPALIVLARSNSSWMIQGGSPPDFFAYFQQLLDQHYERIGGYVVDRQGARWQEPLAEEDVANATLVIFRRRAAEDRTPNPGH